jgi:hypothetical protein|nr:MAG TPA: hypothetical protein [Caudoviricetes sp.]
MDDFAEVAVAIIVVAASLLGVAVAIKGIRELWMWCMA